ncbi:phosphatidylserine decarboxylase [Imleria badia]|nr:phosphatidylserine decarboxylase [Imleria badia]
MPDKHVPVKQKTAYHGWVPLNPEVHKAFLDLKLGAARKRKDSKAVLIQPVADFAKAIYDDSFMRETIHKIFRQVNKDPKWAARSYVADDYPTFLYLLDVIVQEAPAYYKATRESDGEIIGEPIGVPLYLVFDLLSNTSAAYTLFCYPPFNDALKTLLDYWGTYLQSTNSNYTLNTTAEGWFGQIATQDFVPYLYPLTFDETYVSPDSSADNKGYTSWDAFFTRDFQTGARPINPSYDSSLIYNACESTTLQYRTNVQLHDTFWLKDQNYSLYDMVGGHPAIAEKFEGGTVYQAFLSPQDYHRWHSPVKGTIVTYETIPGSVLPGTYYAVLPDDGSPGNDGLEKGDPHGALIRSQPWLTVSSTRAVIFIQADNADIGLMCFIGVGMAEVSTCDVTVTEGQSVDVGDELGMFHFGGSSHALIFGPQAKLTFEDPDGNPLEENTHYWINTQIGKVEASGA